MANTAASYPRNGNRKPEACAARERHWRKILEQWKQSGLSMADFCRREGLKDHTLSWWKRTLEERDRAQQRESAKRAARAAAESARPSFVPVRVIEAAPRESISAVEIVTSRGHVVRLQPGFDAATLRRVLAALEEQPC